MADQKTDFRVVKCALGGWVIIEPAEDYKSETLIAAYSDEDALLKGLASIVKPQAVEISNCTSTGGSSAINDRLIPRAASGQMDAD